MQSSSFGRSAASIFAVAVWGALSAADFWFVARYGPDVPFSDDWEFVPALVGAQPITAAWLWSSHNEHRVPLPRLLLLGLFHLSGQSFRAGMFYNVGALSGTALATLLAARHVRGSSAWADAVFPIALLHWGHFENLLWSWQVAYTTAAALACVMLLVIAVCGRHLTFGSIVLLGSCLLALPLCGANGLLMAFPVTVWLGAMGIARLWRGERHAPWMLAFALGALIVQAAYVLGLEKPAHHTYTLSADDLTANARLLSGFVFGMLVEGLWRRRSETIGLLLFLVAGVLLRIVAGGGFEGRRAAGLLAVMAGAGLALLAVAVGRPGHAGAPRYITLAAPLLITAVWACLLYGPAMGGRSAGLRTLLIVAALAWPEVVGAFCLAWVCLGALWPAALAQWPQRLACILAALMLVPNTMAGLDYARWHAQILGRFAGDLRAGATAEQLGGRYSAGPLRIYPSAPILEEQIRRLHRGRIGLFTQLREGPDF